MSNMQEEKAPIDSKDGSFEAETSPYKYDAETNAPIGPGDKDAFDQRKGEELHRGLKARHVAMISIGGVIGTGERKHNSSKSRWRANC